MIPQSNPELEIAVLSAIMVSNESLLEINDVLDVDCFYDKNHRTIYEKAIIPLFNKNENIDILTVSDKLKKEGVLKQVGGEYYLSKIASTVGGAGNVVEHAYILKESSIKRQIGKLGDFIYENAHKPEVDALEFLEDVTKRTDNIGLKVT